MAFPISPTNGQTVTVNGIVYIYSSATNSWTVVQAYVGDLLNTGNAAFIQANTAYSQANNALDSAVALAIALG